MKPWQKRTWGELKAFVVEHEDEFREIQDRAKEDPFNERQLLFSKEAVVREYLCYATDHIGDIIKHADKLTSLKDSKFKDSKKQKRVLKFVTSLRDPIRSTLNSGNYEARAEKAERQKNDFRGAERRQTRVSVLTEVNVPSSLSNCQDIILSDIETQDIILSGPDKTPAAKIGIMPKTPKRSSSSSTRKSNDENKKRIVSRSIVSTPVGEYSQENHNCETPTVSMSPSKAVRKGLMCEMEKSLIHE